MHNFKELNVWQRAMSLTVDIHKHTKSFPDHEKFGLISQLRRCSVSMVSNIAEGAGRKTDKGFSNFLGMSLGSQNELETQLIISIRVGYLSEDAGNKLIEELTEIQKITWKLIDKFS